MMKETVVVAFVDGRIPEIITARLKDIFEWYRSRNKRFIVTIEPERNKRSTLQNSYYWGVVIEHVYAFYKDSGNTYSRDVVHGALKDAFLRIEIIDPNTGEIVGHRTKSTAELSTVEFSEYVESIRDYYFHKQGVLIPEPNKEIYDEKE